MGLITRMLAKASEGAAIRKGMFGALLAIVLALFGPGNIRSLVLRGDLRGGIANAQSLGDPEDESSPDADGDFAVQPEAVNNVAGTWSGPISDSHSGDGTLTLTILQKSNAASLKGTWTATVSGNPSAGKLKGNENNGTGMIDLSLKHHHHGTCIIKSAITVPDATHMNATYMTTGACGHQSTGSFMLTLQ